MPRIAFGNTDLALSKRPLLIITLNFKRLHKQHFKHFDEQHTIKKLNNKNVNSKNRAHTRLLPLLGKKKLCDLKSPETISATDNLHIK